MKRSDHSESIKRFWEGNTSLPEENSLFDSKRDIRFPKADEMYMRYINAERNKTFSDEEVVWAYIVNAKNRKKKKFIATVGIAASVLILAGTWFFFNIKETKKRNEAQFALLEQTLNNVASGISTVNNSSVNVLYEDNLIVIVAENQ